MKTTETLSRLDHLKSLHDRFVSWSVKILAPVVFYFGKKDPERNISIADLLKYSEGTLGGALANFYLNEKVEPIAGAESHDAYHVLFGFDSSFKDEFALQFFLLGNGKISLAAIGTVAGAWLLYPHKFRFFRYC